MSLRKRLRYLLARRSIEPGRNVLFWWGSFARGGGATVGDLLSISSLSRELQARGLKHSVVSNAALGIGSHLNVRDISELKRSIRTLAFVCGPIVDGPEIRRLLQDHASARKVAAGVSILASSATLKDAFDAIIARDGMTENHFDFAISEIAEPTRPSPGKHLRAGICYRGAQGEYGAGKARWSEAEGLLNATASEFGFETVSIDTVLRPANTSERILAQFREVDVVFTTRMHGSLLAIASGKPVIAIDQISGNGKVKPALEKIGWRAAFSVDDVSADDVRGVCRSFVDHWPLDDIRKAQTEILARSMHATRVAADAICNLAAS